MHICYLDESGTVEANPSTTHFVLLGLAIPASTWKDKDNAVNAVKGKYDILGKEIHTGWILKPYAEQFHIPGFETLDFPSRRRAALGVRALNLARPRSNEKRKSLLIDYKKTEAYVHLTLAERRQMVIELAEMIGSWDDCRLFAESHLKTVSFGSVAFDHAFEQLVTRFNTFLTIMNSGLGLLVQDQNETVCSRFTSRMRQYHREGTRWTTSIDKIVETPLFVDSQLTSMVQLADLCAYVTRRFFEKGENLLFDKIYPRFDRSRGKLVGLRHFTSNQVCACRVCLDHGRYRT